MNIVLGIVGAAIAGAIFGFFVSRKSRFLASAEMSLTFRGFREGNAIDPSLCRPEQTAVAPKSPPGLCFCETVSRRIGGAKRDWSTTDCDCNSSPRSSGEVRQAVPPLLQYFTIGVDSFAKVAARGTEMAKMKKTTKLRPWTRAAIALI